MVYYLDQLAFGCYTPNVLAVVLSLCVQGVLSSYLPRSITRAITKNKFSRFDTRIPMNFLTAANIDKLGLDQFSCLLDNSLEEKFGKHNSNFSQVRYINLQHEESLGNSMSLFLHPIRYGLNGKTHWTLLPCWQPVQFKKEMAAYCRESSTQSIMNQERPDPPNGDHVWHLTFYFFLSLSQYFRYSMFQLSEV